MKVGVLGAGLMGKEATRDLAKSNAVTKIGLGNISLGDALAVKDICASPKVAVYEVDANDKGDLAAFMKEYDVVIIALFYTFNEQIDKTVIEVGTHVVNLGVLIVKVISN